MNKKAIFFLVLTFLLSGLHPVRAADVFEEIDDDTAFALLDGDDSALEPAEETNGQAFIPEVKPMGETQEETEAEEVEPAAEPTAEIVTLEPNAELDNAYAETAKRLQANKNRT